MMIKLSWSFFFSGFLIFLLASAETLIYPSLNGYQIENLISTTTQNRFNFEAETWTSSGLLRPTKTTFCSNYYIMGGPNALQNGGYFMNQFDNLPAHDMIYYYMAFYLIGSWSSTDIIQLLFDSNTINIGNIDLLSSEFTTQACDGTTWNLLKLYTMYGKVPHTGSSLTLKIVSDLTTSPALANFGIRDVYLLFTNKTSSDTGTGSYCFRNIASVITEAVPDKCTCSQATYPDPSNPAQCLPCDSSCFACFGPSSSECHLCKGGYSSVASQCVKCDTSCYICSGPNSNQCVVCASGLWLYWDGTCRSSCTSPTPRQATYDNLWICQLPCPEGQYMLWDGSCVNSCDNPLVVVQNNTGNFCDKPCAGGQFYYANDSCYGSCDLPFVQGVTLNVDICLFKCGSGEFLYENDGSCVSSCGFPFLSRNGVGAEGKFCYSPCNSGQYILEDRSCSPNCTAPYYEPEMIDKFTQLCLEYSSNLIDAIAKVIKTEGQISFGLMIALSIGKMGSSSSLCLASLAKMLEYIKYMRIGYSQRLDLMFQLQGSSELSVNFQVPLSEGIQEKFPDHELPSNFEEYELGSSFFLNYWETLGSLLVILGGVLVLSLLTMITKGKSYHHIVIWLKTVFKWNFVLMTFCSNFEGVVFFTSLEMRTLNVDSFAAFLSLFVCIVANIFAVAILGRIAFILKDIRKLKYRRVHDISSSKGAEKKIVDPHRKWRSYQVLFLHCHEEKPIQQGFFIIFLVRVYFFHLTIGYIFPEPLAQSVIITVLSVLMLAYYIILRPLEEKWDLIKLVISECIVLLVNFCTLVLAVVEKNGKQTQGNTELFSYIIIMANVLFNTLVMIFLGIESVVALSKIYKEIKEHKLKGINSLLEIFMMMFAGEAMAMEEEYLSPDIEVTIATPEKTLAKPKRQEIEIETPQTNDEKIVNVTTAELLKLRSPQSPSSPRSARSRVDEDEGLSVISRGSLTKQSRKPSETVFKFDNSGLKDLEGSQKKPSIFMRSENASMVLLSPPNMGDEKESSLKYESEAESKATPAKVDMNNENEKLLFMNWPEGNVVNLDD